MSQFLKNVAFTNKLANTFQLDKNKKLEEKKTNNIEKNLSKTQTDLKDSKNKTIKIESIQKKKIEKIDQIKQDDQKIEINPQISEKTEIKTEKKEDKMEKTEKNNKKEIKKINSDKMEKKEEVKKDNVEKLDKKEMVKKNSDLITAPKQIIEIPIVNIPKKHAIKSEILIKKCNFSNIINSHDQNLIFSQLEDNLIRFTSDEKFYEDSDFSENYLNILGEFKNSGFEEEYFKNLNFFDIKTIASESFLSNFINKSDEKNEIFWRQKIIMGKLNDTNFLNALGLISLNRNLFDWLCFSDKITMEKSEKFWENGLFFFRFYEKKARKTTILIDNKLPCINLSNSKPIPIFSRSSNENEFYISLIEKGYAKFKNGYSNLQKISFRQSINELSGLEPEFITITKETINDTDLFTALNLLINNKSIIGLIKKPLKSEKKIEKDILNKIFVIMEIIETETNKKFIKLADLWSNTPKISDSKEINLGNSNIQIIEYEEIYKWFNIMIILKDFPENWAGIRLDSEIENENWIDNENYVFEINFSSLNMVFRLCEQNTSVEIEGNIGLYIFKLGPKEEKITKMVTSQLVTNIKSKDESFIQINIILEKGKYCVIPFITSKNKKILELEIYFENRINKINWQFKFEKIFESFSDKILKDFLTDIDLQRFKFSNKELNIKEILIPLNVYKFIMKDYANTRQNSILINQKLKEINSQINNNDKPNIIDAKLLNFENNLISEKLLGLNENEKDENIDLESIEGIYDFNYYGLGDEGFSLLLNNLIKENSLKVLSFAGNLLTDNSIIKLCYELEKTSHLEIEELDFSENNLGEKTGNTILTFLERSKNLKKINIGKNENFNPDILEKINNVLEIRNSTRIKIKKKN